MPTTWQEAANSDPERPADGVYQDLDYVPWYASLSSCERLKYLDWIIAKRKADCEARKAELPPGDTIAAILDRPLHKLFEKYRTVVYQRDKELEVLKPLPDYLGDKYRCYLDSWRWKHRRRLKLVSVRRRCEYPGCANHASECHHLHYETLGFEENTDLEALCAPHHRARHGRI
jgi:hypothetical protein